MKKDNTKREIGFSPIAKVMVGLVLITQFAEAASITDDTWLDQVVTFVKVNLQGNFGYLAIIVGITIGSFSALFGQWKMAGMAFLGGILIGSITFWAETAQNMGQTFG
jgi:type IV secretory pathway VirB2 component (pilin)